MSRNHWEEVKVVDLGKLFTGRTPPSSKPEAFGNEFPFITPSDMDGRKFMYTTERYLSLQGGRLLESIKLPERAICVSCIGLQLGKVAKTTRASFTNQQINSIVPNERVIGDFLYYALTTKRAELKNLGSMGARTPIVNKSLFSQLKIALPPLEIQHRIASILGAYDDLIENNRRRIAILEEMARRFYEEWFVRFRFPGHEQTRMVESPLGPIPEGWKVGHVEDLIVLQRGFDLPAGSRQPGEVPVIAATGQHGTHSQAKVRGPGLVTGRSGTIGKLNYVQSDFLAIKHYIVGERV